MEIMIEEGTGSETYLFQEYSGEIFPNIGFSLILYLNVNNDRGRYWR